MGKQNDRYEGEYCCKDMKTMLQDWRIPFDYHPETNFYYLPFVYPYKDKQGIRFCPWCGVQLSPRIERGDIDYYW